MLFLLGTCAEHVDQLRARRQVPQILCVHRVRMIKSTITGKVQRGGS